MPLKLTITLLCVLGLAQATQSMWQLSTTDGQPGCRTRYELNRLWRHNVNPSIYWKCTRQGVAAVCTACPPSTFFLEHWQTCVPQSMYEWTPPYNPPSSPMDNDDLCGVCPPCAPVPPNTTFSPPETTSIVIETTTVPTTTEVVEIVTEAPTPFICGEERMGLRWPGETGNTYWECYILNEDPFLISCPPGFRFDFDQQTCIL